MIFQAYDETKVRNLQLREVASELLENGQLTPSQYEQVESVFPIVFKQSNVFVRIGLFLFTSLCIAFSIVLFGWVTMSISAHEKGIGVLCLISAFILTALNEFFIRDRNWYRQGSDNALCYAAIICFIFGFGLAFEVREDSSRALLGCFILTLGAVRYGDPLLAFGSFYVLLMGIFSSFDEQDMSYRMLPFVYAGIAVGIYFFTKYASKQASLFYWKDCFTVLEIASLFVFYTSINYWTVALLFEKSPVDEFLNGGAENLETLQNGLSPSFSMLFIALTALVPLVYMFFGIKNKDRILWIMGGLGIATSILTYRHYHSIMPIEWALTLAGTAFLALGYFLMHHLKTPRNGFVYAPERHKNGFIEAVVVNQLTQQTSATPDDSVQYGGGDFGGGGASGDF
jgi:uncharacterized membrane protein YgcG